MESHAIVDAGTCGFVTSVIATAEDERQTTFVVESPCEHIVALATALTQSGPFDVFEEMDWRTESHLRTTIRESLKGCYPWCPVPVGLFKTLQLAAGLSLPQDIEIELSVVGNWNAAADPA